MKKEYTWAVSTLGAMAVAFEIIGVGRGLWLGWLLSVAVVEGIAVARSKPGDTISEHFWSWNQDRKWRALQGIPLGLYIAWRVFAVTAAGHHVDVATGGIVGAALIASILAVWLPGHFAEMGERG